MHSQFGRYTPLSMHRYSCSSNSCPYIICVFGSEFPNRIIKFKSARLNRILIFGFVYLGTEFVCSALIVLKNTHFLDLNIPMFRCLVLSPFQVNSKRCTIFGPKNKVL